MSQDNKIVYVEKDYCTSCGQCAEELPKYFQLDDDYIGESHIEGENVNAALVPADDTEIVQNQMDECPGEGIFWKE